MVWRKVEMNWDEFNAIRNYSSLHKMKYSEVIQMCIDEFFKTDRNKEDLLDDTEYPVNSESAKKFLAGQKKIVEILEANFGKEILMKDLINGLKDVCSYRTAKSSFYELLFQKKIMTTTYPGDKRNKLVSLAV
jgi:hypothetical protein